MGLPGYGEKPKGTDIVVMNDAIVFVSHFRGGMGKEEVLSQTVFHEQRASCVCQCVIWIEIHLHSEGSPIVSEIVIFDLVPFDMEQRKPYREFLLPVWML